MKICLIGGIYQKGGTRSTYVKITPETTLENGFRAAGHDVTTLSHYDEADFGRFDVVHVHHLSYGALRLSGDDSNTPFVFTAHSTAHLAGGDISKVRRFAIRQVLTSADAVVGLSEMEISRARAEYQLHGARLVAIPNGIDVAQYRFRRDNPAGQGAPWRLLFVGQLIPLKRGDLLLGAMAKLGQNVELTLVYQNPQMERELRSLADSLGLAERVRFHGPAGPGELAAFYQQSDLLVLPSDTEALPSVITEAMLCGLPFVASAVGGIPEQANRFGVVLEDRSTESVATAIDTVFKNYGRFQADGEAMSQYARDRFAIDTMVNRHLELYESLQGMQPRRQTTKLALQRGIARVASRWMGTAGSPSAAQASMTGAA